MHVFVDDSGDGGFKLDRGSSKFLVMAAVVFPDPREIEHLARCLATCRAACSHQREFKFTKTSKKVRASFFSHVQPVGFHVRAIVIDKGNIHSPKLRSDPSLFKSWAIRQLLSKTYRQVRDAKVVVDGQDTRAFGISDAAYLMDMVNRETPRTIREVKFDDSKRNIGIQLADMCAGVIRRHEELRKADMEQFRFVRTRAIQPKGNYWRFK